MSDRSTLSEQREFVKILYYGDPGTGKTTATASMAKEGPILFIAAEPGLKARPLVELGVPVQNISIHEAITFDALKDLFWEVKEMIEVGGEDAPVAVIWDSISEAHKKLLEQTAFAGYEKAKNKGQDRERLSIFLEDYGTNSSEMRFLMRRYMDLECHVAFVSLARQDKDKDGTVNYGADMTPKIAADLHGYVDIICHTETKTVPWSDEPQYWGIFRPVDAWQGKDRFHALPPRLIDPTLDRVVAYVNGDLDAESDPVMEAARQALRAYKESRETSEDSAAPATGTTRARKK